MQIFNQGKSGEDLAHQRESLVSKSEIEEQGDILRNRLVFVEESNHESQFCRFVNLSFLELQEEITNENTQYPLE